MELVRRFVSGVLQGDGAPELSDDEWATLCLAGEGSETDEAAIARIVLGAYALRGASPDVAGFPAMPTLREAPYTSEAWTTESAASGVPGDVRWEPAAPIDELLIPAEFGAMGTVAPDQLWEPIPIEQGGAVVTPDDPGNSSEVVVTAWTLVPAGPDPDGNGETGAPRHGTLHRGRSRHSRSGNGTPSSRWAHAKERPSRITDRRRERLIVVTSWVSNIGAIILLFVAWQLWGTAITQHHTQTALKSQFEGSIHHSVAKPAPGFTLLPASTRIPDPPDGSPMAHLQIPKIGLDEIVVSGTDEGDLAKGPGHYLGTAMPGQAGNVAIAGHRTTHGAPFNRLAELAIGDPIYLTTASGQQLTYIVSAVPVAVSPKDVTVLNNFGDDRLTLTTCNPEYSAIQRLIVVAAYLPPGATHPVTIAKGTGRTYALAPAETSGWNTTLLPFVALEVLALVGLGLTYRRLSKIYGKGTRWIILGPIWIALLIALFETLTNFLPAAV
jgi:LPXTG-site transpeptidase (sortase) family protein